MSNEILKNRLLNIEAWAKGLQDECRRTRKLLEADVSTSVGASGKIDEQVAQAVTKFRQRLIKKTK